MYYSVFEYRINLHSRNFNSITLDLTRYLLYLCRNLKKKIMFNTTVRDVTIGVIVVVIVAFIVGKFLF